jgi:hypothetical protein
MLKEAKAKIERLYSEMPQAPSQQLNYLNCVPWNPLGTL